MSFAALVVVAAGVAGSTGVWAWQRRDRRKRFARDFERDARACEDDLHVAAALALHEARSRGHAFVTTLHFVYALVQDERANATIRELGGDPDAIETRALAALDTAGEPVEPTRVLEWVCHLAERRDRKARATDVWIAIVHDDAAAAVLETPPVNALGVWFALVHGTAEPPRELAGESTVNVVVRNDDYSSMELVVAILRDVFELPEPDAIAQTRAIEAAGRAVIARLPGQLARDRVDAARARAREARAPLWIGVEPEHGDVAR